MTSVGAFVGEKHQFPVIVQMEVGSLPDLGGDIPPSQNFPFQKTIFVTKFPPSQIYFYNLFNPLIKPLLA